MYVKINMYIICIYIYISTVYIYTHFFAPNEKSGWMRKTQVGTSEACSPSRAVMGAEAAEIRIATRSKTSKMFFSLRLTFTKLFMVGIVPY